MRVSVILVLCIAAIAQATCPTVSCAAPGGDCSSDSTFCPTAAPIKWSRDGMCTCVTINDPSFPAIGTPCDPQGGAKFCGPTIIRDCQKNSTGGYQCRGNRYSGDTCSNDLDCRYPRTCTNGICTGNIADGAECESLTGGCHIGSYCNGTQLPHRCQKFAGLNEACGGSNNNGGCRVDHFCYNGLCKPRFSLADGVQTGGASDSACQSGYATASAPRTCQQAPGLTQTSCSNETSDAECGLAGECICQMSTTPGRNGFCRLKLPAIPSYRAVVQPFTTAVADNCETSYSPLDTGTVTFTCIERVAPAAVRQHMCGVATGLDLTWLSTCANWLSRFNCGAAGHVTPSLVTLFVAIMGIAARSFF